MTQYKKEQDVAGKWEHMEAGQPFSGTDILVLAPGDKSRTVQCKCANEVEMWLWTVWEDQDHQRPLKPSAISRT